jgi:erythronate-4-phosphate dehydrogenase
MKIAADKNILFAKEAFSTLGDVKLFDQDEIINENIRDFDVLIIRSATKVDENLLSGTKIKFVGSAVIGTDHINAKYLEENDIGFSSAIGCNSRSVAEYVLTAIYTFCEKNQLSPKNMTVGIIGAGNIGGLVAKILKKLGIKTILNDPILEKRGISGFSSLDYLAQNSDIVSVHVPLTTSGEYKTQNFLDDNFFKKLKRDALFIQTSRGSVCDETALSKIRNCVIDVWANEPNINVELAKNSIFHTPHIAGHSFDGKINGAKIIYEACCKYFSLTKKFDFESEVFAKIENEFIEYKDNICDILLKCCPIDDDSRNFEKLFCEENAAERKTIFKNLRQNYRKRLEFSHYTIKNVPKNFAEDLKILGFSVN